MTATISVLMPALSSTMTEGSIAKWLKEEGDEVKVGDVLLEIETDKSVMEVTAVQQGTLQKILFPAGTQNVAVDQPIALLSPPADAPPPPLQSAQSVHEETIVFESVAEGAEVDTTDSSDRERIVATPLARRLAAESGVDLRDLRGSGPGGRVTKRDFAQADPRTRCIPHTPMRRQIAVRLSEAKREVPHIYVTIACRMDRLVRMRQDLGAPVDTRASVNDFIIRACALALQQVPEANVAWTPDAMIAHEDCDIAVAVGAPGVLITPIVRQAQCKSIQQIATDMRDLAARARAGKLKPEEYQGGSFCVSNLGMYGVRQFSAIVNPPQACILAVGAVEERVIAEHSRVVVAHMMTCTLSADHRAVDGVVAARWLGAFRELIENPMSLI